MRASIRVCSTQQNLTMHTSLTKNVLFHHVLHIYITHKLPAVSQQQKQKCESESAPNIHNKKREGVITKSAKAKV